MSTRPVWDERERASFCVMRSTLSATRCFNSFAFARSSPVIALNPKRSLFSLRARDSSRVKIADDF